ICSCVSPIIALSICDATQTRRVTHELSTARKSRKGNLAFGMVYHLWFTGSKFAPEPPEGGSNEHKPFEPAVPLFERAAAGRGLGRGHCVGALVCSGCRSDQYPLFFAAATHLVATDPLGFGLYGHQLVSNRSPLHGKAPSGSFGRRTEAL